MRAAILSSLLVCLSAFSMHLDGKQVAEKAQPRKNRAEQVWDDKPGYGGRTFAAELAYLESELADPRSDLDPDYVRRQIDELKNPDKYKKN